MLRLSNNTDLPEASAFGVKSFWLLLITVLVTACNAAGFQLLPSLCEVGLGCTADEVVAKGQNAVSLIQQLLPILSAVWLWIERRAPTFRLVFRRPAATDTTLHFLGAAILVALLWAAPGSRAWAASVMDAEVLNISPAVVWVIALSQLLTFGLTIWSMLSSGSRANAKRLEEHAAQLGRHSERIQTVEQAMRDIPTRDDFHKLDKQMTQLSGSLDVLTERLKPLEAITDRMQELLLERGK